MGTASSAQGASPFQVSRFPRAHRQSAVADYDDGRISSDACLIRDRFGDILYERLKVPRRQSWLAVRKPSGSISGLVSKTVVIHGIAVPPNAEFLHGGLEGVYVRAESSGCDSSGVFGEVV
jgi:hypothetical protein